MSSGQAAENAVQHVDEFAASMHWVTYRASGCPVRTQVLADYAQY